MTQQDKRKKFYQKKLTLYKSIFSFFMFAGLGIAMLSFFYTVFATSIAAYLTGQYEPGAAPAAVRLLSSLIENQWLYTIAGGILLVLLSTYFTHRFAGPLYRFEVSLDRMANKDFGFTIRLRKNDECETMAEKLNALNAQMSSAITSMRYLVDDLEQYHTRLGNMLSGEKYDLLADAVRVNQKLKRAMAAFKCR